MSFILIDVHWIEWAHYFQYFSSRLQYKNRNIERTLKPSCIPLRWQGVIAADKCSDLILAFISDDVSELYTDNCNDI
jgi:hypothetical protein